MRSLCRGPALPLLTLLALSGCGQAPPTERYSTSSSPLSTTVQKLSTSTSGTLFGQAAAVAGSRVVIGQSCGSSKTGETCSGAVFVYGRSGTSWAQEARVVASDRKSESYLGDAVSVSGSTVAIGSPRRSDAGLSSGAVYLFVRQGSAWTEQQKLAASDTTKGDHFAYSVSLEGDTLLVGAPYHTPTGGGAGAGAVYVFARSGTAWSQAQKLAGAGAGAGFGWSISLNGKVAVVGAPEDDKKGAAYVFSYDGTTWNPVQKLVATGAAVGDAMGTSVSVSGDVIVAGAPAADAGGKDSGAAYVFHRSGSAWKQANKLTAKDGAAGDLLGQSVSVSGDVVAMGAVNDDDKGNDSGAVYFFSRAKTGWTQLHKLVAADGAAGDGYGRAVALDKTTLVVGAPQKSTSKGKAYVYSLRFPAGFSCTDKATCASGHCVDGVCCDTACGGGAKDCQACTVKAGAAKDGACSVLVAGATCRAVAGGCDVVEKCDGLTAACPADAFKASGTICRDSGGDCDLTERCTGSAAACPQDKRLDSATVCRPSAGGCDPAERCSGAAICPADKLKAKGETCRASTGPCDVAEKCGGTAACPADDTTLDGTACGGDGTCRAGVCQRLKPPGEEGCSCDAGGSRAGALWWLLLLILGIGLRRSPEPPDPAAGPGARP